MLIVLPIMSQQHTFFEVLLNNQFILLLITATNHQIILRTNKPVKFLKPEYMKEKPLDTKNDSTECLYSCSPVHLSSFQNFSNSWGLFNALLSFPLSRF